MYKIKKLFRFIFGINVKYINTKDTKFRYGILIGYTSYMETSEEGSKLVILAAIERWHDPRHLIIPASQIEIL